MEVNNKYHIRVTDNESGETVHETETNLFAFASTFGKETTRILGIYTHEVPRGDAVASYIHIIAQLQLLSKSLLESVKKAMPFCTDETVRSLVETACEVLEKEAQHAES